MNPGHARALSRSLLVLTLLASVSTLSVLPTAAAHEASGGPSTLPGTTFVAAPPPGAKGPDDITMMSVRGLDDGNSLIWTAYQNGINPDGTPGTPGGPTQSTVAGYDSSTGALVATIPVTGHVDGLTADQRLGVLFATANEDDNSVFYLINPATGAVTAYQYSPSPAVAGVGGTDSIALHGPDIYISHSNPSDTTQATTYRVTLDPSTLTARLTPVFYDDSSAIDAATGAKVTMALTDPDTSYLMPHSGEGFGGSLATISQGDGVIVFAWHLKHAPRLAILHVTDNVPGNVPPIDGLAVATSGHGTLYVVDGAAGTIVALDTSGWASGTVFVGEPSDNGNPLIGTLDLSTGHIAVLGNTFLSPKGMLFIPAPPG